MIPLNHPSFKAETITENRLLKTITQKIDSTTARVVFTPKLSGVFLTFNPMKQLINPMIKEKNGVLMNPIQKVNGVVMS